MDSNDKRYGMSDRRSNGQGSFFILQLMAIVKKYKAEHVKASSQSTCSCSICVVADKLLKEGQDKWK